MPWAGGAVPRRAIVLLGIVLFACVGSFLDGHRTVTIAGSRMHTLVLQGHQHLTTAGEGAARPAAGKRQPQASAATATVWGWRQSWDTTAEPSMPVNPPGAPVVHLSQGSSHSPPGWFVELAQMPNSWAVWGHYGAAASGPNRTRVPARTTGRLQVIDVSGTTWTSGRNRLYQYASAEANQTDFLYYIFYDDDVGPVGFRKGKWRKGQTTNVRNPPRSNESAPEYFQRLLRTENPAVGVVYWGRQKHPTRAEKICPDEGGMDQCTADVDAMVNAVHRDSARTLLPYDTSFDETNWHMSQAVFIELAHAFFPHRCANYFRLEADNPRHSNYPRGDEFAPAVRIAQSLGRERLGEECAFRLQQANNPEGSHHLLRRDAAWAQAHSCGDGSCCRCRFANSYSVEDVCAL